MKKKRKKFEISNFFVTFFIFFMFLIVSTMSIVRAEIDKKEIERLKKENNKLGIQIHDYEWQTDQYRYMFDNYCGGMNND